LIAKPKSRNLRPISTVKNILSACCLESTIDHLLRKVDNLPVYVDIRSRLRQVRKDFMMMHNDTRITQDLE
jgi:hypothetical protein